jgi:amino acid transporter
MTLADDHTYFVVFSLLGLALAVGLNVAGLGVGKWLHNAGAVGLWAPVLILLVAGGLAFARFGSANAWTARTMVPSTHLKDIIFWSTIAFSLSGVESASMMGEEIREPRRNIPRALLVAGTLITLLYIGATVAVLLALPQREVQSMQGILQAITRVSERVQLAWIVPVTAVLITVSGIGQAGAWFAAAGRLPFVAGIDRLLPGAFGRLHRRTGAPYVALLVQAAISALIIFLGQAGSTVQGAYDVLVSMSIIAYFIPYLFMFAAMIRLQREPAGPGVIRVPGGKPVALVLASVGFATTAVSIGLSMLPPESEPRQGLAVLKIVGLTALLLLIGVALYASGRGRAARHALAGTTPTIGD